VIGLVTQQCLPILETYPRGPQPMPKRVL
jgi:hypothetical protein